MKPSALRRRLLSAALSLAAAWLPHAGASAQVAWPQSPVSVVLGFSAGSGVDIVARAIQEPLSKLLGQPVVVDYKTGAGGNIASRAVAAAAPDGYTLALGTAASHGANAALYPNLPFDVEADFTPIATLIDVSNVLTVNPEVIGAKTLAEFVDLVRANPGKYSYASTGNGTGTHLAFAEFAARLGLQMTHVPYKGGPEAMTSVLKGETCCIMNQVQSILAQYKAGKVRLLGVTTAKRVSAVPEIPTLAESGLAPLKGYESTIWFGLFGPRNTDPRAVARLSAAVRQVLEMPEIRAKLEGMGNQVRIETPEQFRATVKADRQKWAAVVRQAQVKLD